MSEIECSGIRSESDEEKRDRVRTSLRAGPFPVINPLSLLFIEQGSSNVEEINILRRHWEIYRKSFPVAGIVYSNGRPLIFCAKVMDFMNEEDLTLLYKNIRDSFLYFTDKYSLSISQKGQCALTLCFGFRDPESIEIAKKFLESGGHDMHLFRRTFVETWIMDLNTLELIQGAGFLRKTGQTISETTDEVLKKNKVLCVNETNLSSDALTKPSSFIQYIKSFNAEIEDGTSGVPAEWIERFRPECINLKILSYKNQILKIETVIEGYERKIGEELLSNYKKGFSFNNLDNVLTIVLDKQNILDRIEEDILSIKKLRFQWKESRETVKEIQESVKALDEQYKNSCYQLTKTLFEQEREAVKKDPVLRRIFEDVLQTQAEIIKRNWEILELRSKKAGFFDRVKSETKVMYLKGINQVYDWNKDKKWVEIGEEVVNSSLIVRSLSSVEPIFKTIEELETDREILDTKTDREMKLQTQIKKKIKSMSDSSEYAYPWLELEEKLISRTRKIRQELSELFLSLGKSFLMTPQEVSGSNLQNLYGEIRVSESQIIELKKEIEDLGIELRKSIS
ncbi:hypothetical protein [Methanosarcina sp.]|uniref:hypothetical protein n=1 Tax=Methanosarcina sp. TaxID=2213 RepID=UPI003C76919C